MSKDICCPKGSYGRLDNKYSDWGLIESVNGM
jgi:hypothetical protein